MEFSMLKRMFIAETWQNEDGSWERGPFIERFEEVPDVPESLQDVDNPQALSRVGSYTKESTASGRP